MAPVSKIPDMLNNREKPIPSCHLTTTAHGGGCSLTLLSLIEDAHTKTSGDQLILDFQNFVKVDMLFHLDQPVSVNESLQVQAKHIGQLVDELLMTGPRLTAIVLVVLNGFLFEVRVKALLDRVCMAGYLEVEDVKWFVCSVHLLAALNMELCS